MMTRPAKKYITEKVDEPLGFSVIPVPVITNLVPCMHLPWALLCLKPVTVTSSFFSFSGEPTILGGTRAAERL